MSPQLDHWLYRSLAGRRQRSAARWPAGMRWVSIPAGAVRVYDSGGDKPPLVFAPDGPCVIEHYAALRELLAEDFRVIVFDLPGFGLSPPPASYLHRLAEGADVVTTLLAALDVPPATLVMSCVNGFYALAAAQRAPQRISRLILCQTPSIAAMQDWTDRVVPAPIKQPILGQLLGFSGRRRIARGWYRLAVADQAQCHAFDETAMQALHEGGCFCFAGVVQGMQVTDAHDPLLQPPADLPVTLVWGEADRSHRRTDPDSLRAHCPQAEILRMPGVGHFPELEAPEAFAAVVRARCLAS